MVAEWAMFLMFLAAPLAAEPAQPAPSPGKQLFEKIVRLSTVRFPSNEETEQFETGIGQLYELFPEEPAALLWAGRLADQNLDVEKAIGFWEQALKKQGTQQIVADQIIWAECSRLLGERALGAGDVPAAVAYARQALQHQPGDPQALRLLIGCCFRSGEFDMALTEVRRAHKSSDQGSLEVTLLYFDLLADLGEWDQLSRLMAEQPAENARHLHLFQARLLDLKGDSFGVFCELLLGSLNGDDDQSAARECKTQLDRYFKVSVNSLPEPIRVIVDGYFAMDRPDLAKTLLPKLREQKATSPNHRLILDFLIGTCLGTLDLLDDAKVVWKNALETNPRFLPAMVSLAEILQAEKQSAEADRLFEAARKMSSTNWKVQELDRLGADYEVVPDGVRLKEVVPEGYWHAFGAREGDTLLQLDNTVLESLTDYRRLRTVRLFQGGTVSYRTAAGEKKVEEMELILFGF